ncbi:MAG: queuosine precursor transporter [Lachnospiraceae bacterium]|nr:queuosine precursor transporter [Lachnospiraceae bacterium]MBQ2575980.1 queuosine precursor transporter [Lachnospiraceae bacterium]MBQ5484470.1 queuosine precursor transporter [Lachnospiraceae bacterium]MCR4731866.1 queuosine precursor transporter [Lachnospiraceae bacterium]MEE3354978.1 queuosine precursor transporter [Candidatus Weimeria sp.]
MKEKKNTYTGLFVIIAMAYVTCLLISNLIAGKMWAVTDQITLPAAVVLFPVTYIFGDVFTEVYGFARARLIIWMGFFCSFFAVAMYMLTIVLPHPGFWGNQQAFATVLGTTPRVFVASLAGYLFGEFSNSMVLSKMKVATKGEKLWMRTIGSTIVGEAFDSFLFVTISFAGTMPAKQLVTMILCQYLFKVIFEAVCTPLTYLVVGFLKKKEGVDTFDYEGRYNPFLSV